MRERHDGRMSGTKIVADPVRVERDGAVLTVVIVVLGYKTYDGTRNLKGIQGSAALTAPVEKK